MVKRRAGLSTEVILGSLLSDIFYQVQAIKENELAKNGLKITAKEMHTIVVVARNNNQPMKVLASELRIDKSTLSINTTRLINKGLLKKVQDKRDRRFFTVSLTEKGKKAYKVNQMFEKDMINSMTKQINQNGAELSKSLEGLMHFFRERYVYE